MQIANRTSRMKWTPLATGLKPSSRCAFAGNSLMEYVVPAVIILLAAGVFITITDTTGLMANFYLSASGRSSSSLSGTALQTKGLGEDSYGNVDNGVGAFTTFGTLTPVAGTGGTSLYVGQVTRTGSRGTASSTDYLFP